MAMGTRSRFPARNSSIMVSLGATKPKGIKEVRISSYSNLRMGKFFPHGDVNKENFFHRRVNGDGEAFPIFVPHGDSLNIHVIMFSCNN